MGGIGIGLAGSALSAYLSAKEAKKQRKFQERMAKTKYQYSMEDMRKAGLNPILAYKGLNASTPSGAMGQVPDFGLSAARGAEAETKVRAGGPQRKQMGAQAAALGAQAGASTALEAKYNSETKINQARLPYEAALGEFFSSMPEAAQLQKALGIMAGSGGILGAYKMLRGTSAKGLRLNQGPRLTGPGRLERQWMKRDYKRRNR